MKPQHGYEDHLSALRSIAQVMALSSDLDIRAKAGTVNWLADKIEIGFVKATAPKVTQLEGASTRFYSEAEATQLEAAKSFYS